MTEEWKTIPLFPKYEVSTLGRVRRANNHKILTGCILDGRRRYTLRHNGKKYGVDAARLMCYAFRGLVDGYEKLDARHLDGNPLNNVLSNVDWGTRKDNMVDMVHHGNACHSFTKEEVLSIRQRADAGESQHAIARSIGRSVSVVNCIVLRKTYNEY